MYHGLIFFILAQTPQNVLSHNVRLYESQDISKLELLLNIADSLIQVTHFFIIEIVMYYYVVKAIAKFGM